jgi:hypothetical protein
MNNAHLPILLPIVGLVLLISGLILKSDFIKRAYYYTFIVATVILSFVSLYNTKLTGTSGGEIRHTEIRDTEACVTPLNTPSLDSTCVPSNLNGDSQFQEQRFSHLNQAPVNLSFSYFVL